MLISFRLKNETDGESAADGIKKKNQKKRKSIPNENNNFNTTTSIGNQMESIRYIRIPKVFISSKLPFPPTAAFAVCICFFLQFK